MKQEEWIKQLNQRISEHEETAPEGLWDDVLSALHEHGGQPARVVPLRRWAAAAAVVALLGGLGYWIAPSLTNDSHMAENNPSPETTTLSAPSAVQHHANPQAPLTHTAPRRLLAQANRPAVIDANLRLPAAHTDEALAATVAETPVTTVAEPPAEQQSAPQEPPAEHQSQTVVAKKAAPQSEARLSSRSSVANLRSDSRSGRWTAGLMASNVHHANMSPQVSVQPVVMSAAKYHALGYENYSASAWAMDATHTLVNLDGYEERWEHDQPVSFGLSVSYRITNRWSVETGLNYTRLSSVLIRTIHQSHLTDHQKLHYVGIPLSAIYRLWSFRPLTLYVQGGGQIEKNVKATQQSEGIPVDMQKDRLQWSAHTALGLQLNALPSLGVYLQPGLQYYFDNGSPVQNIYKEKKLNFTLQLGVRIEVK